MDQSEHHRLANQQAYKRIRIGQTRADSYGTSLATVHYKNAKGTQLSNLERSDSTTISIWWEVFWNDGPNDKSETKQQFAGLNVN